MHAASAGRVNPGPGPAEQRRVALLERVRTPIPGSRRIVVLSRKGGVGKTTTSLMLGHTFATHRGDRVVALDANPDAGSLALRLRRETRFTATDLLAERAYIERYAQLREFTSQDAHSRLEVVASDDDPGISCALGADDYTQLIDVLDKHFNLVIVDTGTGILDDAIQGILAEADQLVVVMAPAVDGGRVAAMTLDWLDQHGHGALVTGAIAVVNGVRGEGKIDLGSIARALPGQVSGRARDPVGSRPRRRWQLRAGRRPSGHSSGLSRPRRGDRRGLPGHRPGDPAEPVVTPRGRLRLRRALAAAAAALVVLAGTGLTSAAADPGRRSDGPAVERHTVVLPATARAGLVRGDGGLGLAVFHAASVHAENVAFASASCDGCAATAVSLQVVLADRGPTQLTVGNAAVATTAGCADCEATAIAYQFVVAVDGWARLSEVGRSQLREIDRQAQALARSGQPGPQVQQAAQSLAARVLEVLVGQLSVWPQVRVTRDHHEHEGRGHGRDRRD